MGNQYEIDETPHNKLKSYDLAIIRHNHPQLNPFTGSSINISSRLSKLFSTTTFFSTWEQHVSRSSLLLRCLHASLNKPDGSSCSSCIENTLWSLDSSLCSSDPNYTPWMKQELVHLNLSTWHLVFVPMHLNYILPILMVMRSREREREREERCT